MLHCSKHIIYIQADVFQLKSNSIRTKEAPNHTSINFLKRFTPWSYTIVEEVFLLQNWKEYCNLSRNIYLRIFFKVPELLLLESWLTSFSEHKLFACKFQVEEKIASVDADWRRKCVSNVLWLLKHMLPIRFKLLITTIVPNRCACLCWRKMRTSIL